MLYNAVQVCLFHRACRYILVARALGNTKVSESGVKKFKSQRHQLSSNLEMTLILLGDSTRAYGQDVGGNHEVQQFF